ncbi:hypothetical protein BDR05DRAFT_969949, partial [Suillus weaverae]
AVLHNMRILWNALLFLAAYSFRLHRSISHRTICPTAMDGSISCVSLLSW